MSDTSSERLCQGEERTILLCVPLLRNGHVGKKTNYLDSLADEYAVMLRRQSAAGDLPSGATGAEQEVLRAELKPSGNGWRASHLSLLEGDSLPDSFP